jgi:TRAP-type C4-dicarboxylate transport system substrate-binding protein
MAITRKKAFAASIAILGLAMTGCSSANVGSGDDSGDGAAAQVTVRTTNLLPPSDAQSIMIQWFMDELEKRTDGEVKGEVVHGGALLAGDDTLPGLQQGRADAGNVVQAYFPADLPLQNINTIPVDGDQSARLRSFQATADTSSAWQEELERNGLVLVGYLPNTSSTAVYDADVENLDDVAGLSLRLPSQNESVVWEEFGVEPVFMPTGEVYEAVERGIVNGTSFPMGTQISVGITDVAKTMTPGVGQVGSGPFVFSQRIYDKLSDNAKEVFAELQGEWYDKADEVLAEAEAQACTDFLESGGHVVLWDDADKKRLKEAMPLGVETWKAAAVQAGASEDAADEVWDTFSSSVEELKGTTGYTDGLVACFDQQ